MHRFALLLGVALSLITTSAVAQNCAGFSDVPASSPFCPDVTWITTYGITKGCAPSQFCPNENVSRLQMAAFMHRLGENPAFVNGGNTFGTTAQIGTADNQTIEIVANGQRGFRIEPNATTANLFGGFENNGAYAGVVGATIAGGGASGSSFGVSKCPYAFGCQNSVTDNFGTIGGGAGNLVGDTDGDVTNGEFATVAGGVGNAASLYSFIGGGAYNVATGSGSVIGGGFNNSAPGADGAVGGGEENTASGAGSFVAGGNSNTASGAFSFAAGAIANADADGCVVFANGNSTLDTISCSAPNRFVVRADGGYFLYSSASGGAYLAPGTSAWSVISDREAKSNIKPVDPEDVLERLAAMPVSTWRWTSEPGERLHMGPMAQDFSAAFGLGDSDKRIVTVDADGVAFAAIQGLHGRNARLELKQAEQAATIREQQREIAELRERVQKAEAVAADVVALKAALAELQRGRETVAVK